MLGFVPIGDYRRTRRQEYHLQADFLSNYGIFQTAALSGPCMRIEDRFIVAAPRSQVWAAIIDPTIVAPCVPGCQAITVASPILYKAKIRVQLGVIKADFNVEVELTAQMPPEELRSRARGEEGGRASSISAENVLRLVARSADETEVSYASDVSVVGRLGKFGLGVMRKKAEGLGRDFAAAFKARVEAAVPQK